MRKEVLVKVKGTQTNDLGEQDTIELITEGSYFVKAKSYYLVYSESVLTGMEGTTTSIKAESEKVTLNRMGTAELKQIFEVGVFNSGCYITPYGQMQLAVLPSKVKVDLTDAGGSINLEYELKEGTEKISDNQLQISIESLAQ